MRVNYEEILDFLWGVFETFSRRDLGWVLAGYRLTDSDKRAIRMLYEMRRRGMIVQHSHEPQPRYVIAVTIRRRAAAAAPSAAWDKPWDGQWRVVTYDLPEIRRKERFALWATLRNRKLGLLQRSVWIWPHPVEPILREVLKARGIPECFCGFEAGRLFLCSTSEVVQSAWDWEEIARRHGTYLKHLVATPAALTKARDLPAVIHLARVEREAYRYALWLDPLLPRELCPPRYTGFGVEDRHKQFRAVLTRRLRASAVPGS